MVVREQKRTRAISVGARPSEASSTMCIRSLRLGFVSRFILRMRSLRCWEERRTLSISGRLFCGWLDLVSHTMPQEMAVCSTILCIYIAGAPAPVTEQLEAPEGLSRWRSAPGGV